MELQQQLPSSSLWIRGVVVNINTIKQFGFIRPQIPLPSPFCNGNVYFSFHKVSWQVRVNEHVEFQLDRKKIAKPAAYAIRPVRHCGAEPTCSLLNAGIPQPCDVTAYEHEAAVPRPTSHFRSTSKISRSEVHKTVKPEAHIEPQYRPKRRMMSLMCEERWQGKVAKVSDKFGFIRSDTIKPCLKELSGDLYFPVGSLHTGHFALEVGDLVSFWIREKTKLQAIDVRLIRCNSRPVEIIEGYISSLLKKMEDSDDVESREHVIIAVTCLPVWECIGHVSNMTDNGLRMLVELLLQFSEKEFMKENAKVVLETLHQTPMFKPRDGRFSCYMNDLMTCGLMDELCKLQLLIVVIAQLVPNSGCQLTELVKPLISSEKSSRENFLYQLLRQFTKGSACTIENMQWNDLPLVPSAEELASGKLETFSSLQRVIEKGCYPSSEAYIDTYFRLLRVDCFSAMAKGVTDLLSGTLDSRDMNVYRGIRLAGIQLTHSGSCSGLSVGLEIVPHKKINWEQSSNLMFGNLLCISVSGRFQDPIWATVVSRDLLKQYQIVVIELCSENNSASNSETLLALYFAGQSSVMVESPTYYRAYQPVLKALQSTDIDQFVFRDELIKCHQGTNPEYITTDTEFDASIIYTQPSVKKLNAVCYSIDEMSLGPTGLDASQEAAIKECLRNRVAIIQGPPGTGKTFVGVKIVELLLSFSTPVHVPILILTYKNHSLDEFLKEMLKIAPNSVARIGGRSQEKELSSCTLNELRRSKENRVSEPVFKEIMFFKEQMDQLKQEINAAFDKVHKQQYFSVDSLLQSFDHAQLEVFLLQCHWGKTKQKPFKPDSQSEWQRAGNTITHEEVKHIVRQCSQSTIGKEVETGMNDANSLGAKLYKLLKSALSLWLPKQEDFRKFEENFLISQGSVVGRYDQFTKAETMNGDDDWNSSERDTEETTQERLAAAMGKQSSHNDVLKDFQKFDKDQKGHLLKIAPAVVGKSAAGLLIGVRNLWDLTTSDRILLIQYVLEQTFTEAGTYLESLFNEYEKMHRTKEELEDQQKVNILQRMKVIGMTITGANINRSLIAQIKPEVILVEEAAEVLEPQLVAVMGNWTKQLIMIGDHKQLRPSVENYKLARDYHLDLSLMERLINNGLSYATLTMQNRMRPEFAELLLDIYPRLQSNLARVESNEAANCIGCSMYFWNHQELELSERSFLNKEEAERAVRLALFLVEQGYQPWQITILSPYLGQVRLIRQMVKAAEKEFADLFMEDTKTDTDAEGDVKSATKNTFKVHTVDLYQGDENDFVIVSLVRSNQHGNVGFLNVLNRRCVAQSRARCGLYFIGNRQTLSNNRNWNVLIEGLAKSHCLDTFIPLHCPFHPSQTRLIVSNQNQIPLKQSFCKVPCEHIMPCKQHRCKKTCQPRHSHDICREQVQFTFEKCGHNRKRECHQDEKELICKAEVQFIFGKCRHIGYRKCYQTEEAVLCSEKCTKVLDCSHPCERKCGEPCNDSTNCSECKKIIAAEAEKRRQAEKKLRNEIRDECRRKIEEITKQNPEESMHKEELQCDGDHAEEYYSIEDKVKKYVQPGHKWFPRVTRIEKLVNMKLELDWLKVRSTVFDPSRSDLKFHGTTSEAVKKIIQSGFKLPYSKGQMFGPGIYFASDSSKSAQELYTKGSNMLLVCEVLLGKAKTVDRDHQDMTYSKLKAEGYDSLFAKRDTKDTGGVLYDEFVVYDPRQAIPRYVVHFETMDCTAIASNVEKSLLPVTQAMMHHHIPAPKRARSLNALEMEFCIAESQFLRLMRNSKQCFEVESVDLYLHPDLMRKFELMQAHMESKYAGKDESRLILAFHGTKLSNIHNIVKTNFDLSKLASGSGDRGHYGAGIYFSEFPEVSIGYGDVGKLLLCKVLPGKSYDCPTKMEGQGCVPEHDSHRFHADAEGRGQELVIFNADQILPCYVINYK